MRGTISGLRLLARGFGMWSTSPRLMLLGAIPALIVTVVYTVLLVLLVMNLGALAEWATPFAGSWDAPWRTTLRVVVGIAILGLSLLIAVYTFAALTLAIGDPFYERIWRAVEEREGGAPESEGSALASIARGVGNGIRLLLLTSAVGAALLLVGLIPFVGQVLALTVGALFGGWVLALELTGFAFDARGLTLRERRRMLGRRRSRTIAFGVATYVLFLIPLVAIVLMPSAVAGATLLAREALEEGADEVGGSHETRRASGGPGAS